MIGRGGGQLYAAPSSCPIINVMEEEDGVAIAADVEMVSVGLHADLLLRLDCYCDAMKHHPATPNEIHRIPFWAFRSNVIQAAVGFFLDDPELPLFESD